MNKEIDLSNKRIIISRTDSIGDVMLTLPLCAWIKENFSNVHLIFLGNNYTKPVVQCFSAIDQFADWKETENYSEKEKIEKMILTNDKSTNSSPFHFSTYKLTNNSTKISTTKGHFTTTKTYDSISKQFLVFDVDSQSGDQSKNVSLKGAPGDGNAMKENFRTKYSGKMDTENVHKNYYYSETQNQVNLDNMVRISVDLVLPNANFNLYKFQKIEIAFINQKNGPSNPDVNQSRISGEWMIIDIAYNWNGSKLSQEVKCVRKELSKTPEEIKSDVNNTSAKPEVNTQNNENPTSATQSAPTNTSLPPNSIYKVGEVYTVESKDGKKYTLKITSISTNGNEVNAVITNA